MPIDDSAATKVAEVVLKHCRSLNLTTSGNLRLGTSKSIKPESFFKAVLSVLLDPRVRAELFAGMDVPTAMALPDDTVFNLCLYDNVKRHFEEVQAEAVVAQDVRTEEKLSATFFNADIPRTLGELTIVHNVEVPRRSFLYDKAADVRFPMSWEHVKERLGILLKRNEYNEYVLANSIDCVIGYQPLAPRIIDHPRTPNVHLFNTWDAANWTKAWSAPAVGTPKPKAPELFSRLVGYLARGDEDAHFIQAWMRDCIFARAEPIMVFCGVPGTGKNLLVEEVLAKLVGEQNFRMASRGFNRSQFHSNVTACRLFYLDEMKLTDHVRETLKAYHNGKAAIERKSVDVGDPEPLHASFALSNNDESGVFLEYSDRKFYVPDLALEPIEARIGRVDTQVFADELKQATCDEGWLLELATYLHQSFPEGEATKFVKDTATFKAVCMNGYPLWLRDLRNMYDLQRLTAQNSLVMESRAAMRGIKHRPSYSEAKASFDRFALSNGKRFADARMRADGSWDIIFNPEALAASGVDLAKTLEGGDLTL